MRELRKLGPEATRLVTRYLRERIASTADPRRFGLPLRASLHGLWRYRVGDFRIIASIEDQKLIVLVVRIGHRKDVYES